MRKDIFVVGARLLGVWQLVGALNSLAYLISYWSGFYQPPSYSSQYYWIHFGTEFILGLYLVFRPYHLFRMIERLAESDNEGQEDSSEIKEESDAPKT